MVQLTSLVVLATVATVSVLGAPINKRIAQTIADSTAKWEKSCLAAGGADKCNPISVTAFSTLLAAAGPCEQQDAADQMVDLAKTLDSDADMITLAQIFVQQPRNTPTAQSVPYCQTAPKNAELDGLFQCQFQGADPQAFVGGLTSGDEGTIPFGLDAPLDPAGSCKANPEGPIADGSQLSDLTQDPGVDNQVVGMTVNNGADGDSSADTEDGTQNSTGDDGTCEDDEGVSSSSESAGSAATASDAPADTETRAASASATATRASSAATASATSSSSGSSSGTGNSSGNSSSSSSGGFLQQNGQDAQDLNDSFSSLTSSSQCNEGDQACVDGGFAQCVSGAFVVTQCSGGLVCKALPLVNKAGTSITCTTEADAEARISSALAGGK